MNVSRNFTISHFLANLIPLAILKKFKIIFSKNQYIFLKTQTLNILRRFTILVAFYGKFATFSDSEKIQYFFSKNPSILFKKAQFLNVLRNFTISVAIYIKFATFSDFEKIQYCFSKNPSTFFKNPNFEHFEKYYFFSRILRQICYL